jgi:hybrid cluster-associated redox disulfide protein
MAQLCLTADTKLAELFRHAPQVALVFVRHRMACVGCVMAPFESIAAAAAVYHVPLDRFLQELQHAAQSPHTHTRRT